MTKVLITGSKGTIGSVLMKGLAEKYELIGLDLPESDISDYPFLLKQMKGVDTVIHIARGRGGGREIMRSGRIDPANVLFYMNVFQAVIEAKVKRLIMASSVHADNFNDYEGDGLLKVPGSYKPITPYGTHKLIIEEIGKFYSSHYNFEFIGVRFGGVTPDNSVKTFGKEPQVWLSHNDLVTAIDACVSAKSVPGRFAVFYAVSNNDGRLHDTANSFGWQPQDNSSNHMA